MADVHPFRGFRYNRTFGDLGEILAPPVITLPVAEQRALYQRSPYNVGLVEFGEPQPTDASQQERAERAGVLFRRWEHERILVREERPAFYLLRQRFALQDVKHERLGLVACVRLEPFEKRVILPHESTIELRKRDRLALMMATRANARSMLTLYRDRERRLRSLFLEIMQNRPPVQTMDQKEVQHAVWVISDRHTIEEVRAVLATETLFIADGHHRYETGLAFREHAAQAAGGPASPERAADFIMMTLIEMDDPGLFVLPYNRLLAGMGPTHESILQAVIEDLFHMRPYAGGKPGWFAQFLTELHQISGDRPHFGLLWPGGREACFLEPRARVDSVVDAGNLLESCDAWFLQEHMLRPALGDEFHRHVLYRHDVNQAVELVRENRCQMGFFLRPLPIALLAKTAYRGLRLPPKATYVYPKLAAGTVIQSLEGEL